MDYYLCRRTSTSNTSYEYKEDLVKQNQSVGFRQGTLSPGSEAQELCKLFGVTKQAYYKHDEMKTAQRTASDAFALESFVIFEERIMVVSVR